MEASLDGVVGEREVDDCVLTVGTFAMFKKVAPAEMRSHHRWSW